MPGPSLVNQANPATDHSRKRGPEPADLESHKEISYKEDQTGCDPTRQTAASKAPAGQYTGDCQENQQGHIKVSEQI
jgi:hypothetical protein